MTTLDEAHAAIDRDGYTPATTAAWDAAINAAHDRQEEA